MTRKPLTLAILLAVGIGLSPDANAQGKLSRAPQRQAAVGNEVSAAGQGPLALLVRNNDTSHGAPPYALLDQYGQVQRYVEPTPGVDLARHVGTRVRIRHDTGLTLLASQLDIEAGLTPLRNSSGEFSEPNPVRTATHSKRLRRLQPSSVYAVVPAQLTEGQSLTEQPAAESILTEPEQPSLPAPALPEDPAAPLVLEEILAEDAATSQPVIGDASPIMLDGSEALPPLSNSPLLSNSHNSSNRNPAYHHTNARGPCPQCGHKRYQLGDCCLGDPLTLQDELGLNRSPISFGGWTQIGYHSENIRLSAANGDGLAFNDNPDRLNLHQQWLWVEKKAQPSAAGFDWGFRGDLIYGTDAGDTQAFGNPPGEWDFANGWDRGGSYGWAMPQLYGEIAWDYWTVIAGHFFTIAGYETVTAPDNFFYSHSLTMFNSEPFTHTGVLASYSGFEGVDFYGGWTAGWDTGFDSSNSGSSFIGGASGKLLEEIQAAYILTAGNFGNRSNGGNGYSHSIVLEVALTEKLDYVFQTDFVGIDEQNGAVTANDQVGLNQYLIYRVNDCWGLGSRLEWWKSDGLSYHEVTFGLNYRPHANIVIRPEVRYDWTPSDAAAGAAGFATAAAYEETTFGVDAIFTY